MIRWAKRIALSFLVLALGAGLYLAMREKPVPVDTALVAEGNLTISISEEGKTRVRDVYTLSSPMAGHLDRITLNEGERVVANETIVASIHPLDPPFLDERTRDQLRANAEAARSAVGLAKTEAKRSRMALDLANSEHERAQKLAEKKIIPLSQLEKAWNNKKLLEAQVESADASVILRQAELESATVRLRQPGEIAASPSGKACCVAIRAPVDGVVLKLLAQSEQAVVPGTRLVEIGDPQKLEIVVDLLSRDAYSIGSGTHAGLTEWGGGRKLKGTVRRIDPAAFTKVSSLGIEEQRVNAIIDLDDVPDGLGHGFSILVTLQIWQADVLKFPIGALFRHEARWAVFLARDGKAVLTTVEVGRMNASDAEVVDGLSQDDEVILYPSDRIEDGSAVITRSAENSS